MDVEQLNSTIKATVGNFGWTHTDKTCQKRVKSWDLGTFGLKEKFARNIKKQELTANNAKDED